MRFIVLVTMTSAVPLAFPGFATGGFLPYHASAQVYATATAGGDPGVQGTGSDSRQGQAYASATAATQAATGFASGTAGGFAEAGFPVAGVGRLFASADATATTTLGGYLGHGEVVAAALWQDILFLTPPAGGDYPMTVRFSFELFGSVGVPAGLDSGAGRMTGYVSGYGGVGGVGVVDTLDVQAPGGFSQTLRIDVPLDPGGGGNGPGSVSWQLYLAAHASATRQSEGSGAVGANGDPALGRGAFLTAITLPDFGDQTPEALGYAVAFDSGGRSPNAAVTAVPEPASATLIAIGAALCGLTHYRRRLGCG